MASVFISSPAEVVVIDSRTRAGTVTLPLTNSIPYRVINFKDQYGSFSNSTFTISTQVGESFDDGTTSKTFSNAFSYLSLYSVSSKWMVMNATQTVQQTISSLTVNQLTFGSGAGWVQFGPLQASIVSSIQEQTNAAYINNLYIGTQSTVNSAQYNGLFGNYNNTVLAEVSTGSGSQEFLVFKGSSASDRVRVQTTGNFVVETGVSTRLWNSNTTQTLSNTTPAFIINTSSNVGIQTASPATTLDVAGTGRFQQLSTLNINLSTINGLSFGAPINSTVIGLGSAGYISTAQLVSTTAGLVDHLELTSTIAGLGTIGYISSSQLVSSIAGLGQRFLSSIPPIVSTNAIFTSSILASTMTTSSLQVNSLTIGTGTGWVNLGPLQTVAISSIQENTNALYANTVYVGSFSTVNAIQYNGLFGNDNNTVLAEISTGAGIQELLVFKGSSASDRVRVQTTGAFVVETGVSARLWDSNTLQTLSNATPAFVINTSSNVGIQTSNPLFPLDVAGTGRFQQLSTLSLLASSITTSVIPVSSLRIGNLSSQTAVFYPGLQSLYNGTVVAEVSTGGGSQELLFYKTSTTTDRFRFQTTGSYVIETGVSARAWPFNSSNATPSFIINTSSNVGIQTATPQTALDVAGVARATVLSSQLAFVSSYVGFNVSTTIGTVSSLTINSLQVGDGTGWLSMPPIQTVALSTIQMNANTSFTLTTSTLVLNASSITGVASPFVSQGRLTANQNIPRATNDVLVQFVSDFDPQGWLQNAGTSTARVLPRIAGYYSATYTVWWSTGTGTDQLNIQIRKNGQAIAINQQVVNTVNGLTMTLTKMAYMNGSSDYFDFSAFTGTGGATQTIQFGGSANGPGVYYSVYLIR